MSHEPDAEQSAIISAAHGERLLVMAPPGAGKTWTAACRLSRLATAPAGDDQDDEGGRFLALSFSRAAAFAMAAQIHHAGAGSRVEVRTIDSWATMILRGAPGDGVDLDGLDYDQRISAALVLLTTDPSALTVYRHIVIDEAQDIHGARADLLELLLTHPSVQGWTVLGDPAQAIYGFSGKHGGHLFDRLRARQAFQQTELQHCHRTQVGRLNAVAKLGEGLRGAGVGPAGRDALWEAFSSLPPMSAKDFLIAASSYAKERSTAVLLRDNRAVLALSLQLGLQQTTHGVSSGRSEGIVPDWVASLCPAGRNNLDEQEVRSLIPEGLEPDPIVRSIRTMCQARAGAVRTDQIADFMLSGRLPEALLQPATGSLTLSTIHRAKGLEFGRVLVGSWDPTATGEDPDDAARVLCVAMTRARSKLIRLVGLDHQPSRRDNRTRRWVDFRFVSKKETRVTAVEVRPSDINLLLPWHSLEARLPALEALSAGCAVEFVLAGETRDNRQVYTVRTRQTREVLGIAPLQLSDDIEVLFGSLPDCLVGAQIAGRRTVALPAGTTSNNRRLFVAPVIRGMVHRDQGE